MAPRYIFQVVGTNYPVLGLYEYMLANSQEFQQHIADRYLANSAYNSGQYSLEEFYLYIRYLAAGKDDSMAMAANPCLHIDLKRYSICHAPAGRNKLCKAHSWFKDSSVIHSEVASQDDLVTRKREFNALFQDSLSDLKNLPFPNTVFRIYRMTHDLSPDEEFIVGLELSRTTLEGKDERFGRTIDRAQLAAMENAGCRKYLIYSDCTCCS